MLLKKVGNIKETNKSTTIWESGSSTVMVYVKKDT
jgi:hypothetical protein